MFRATYPGLTFYVKEAGSRQIATDVAEGKLDLGIVTTPVNDKGLNIERLMIDKIVLIAPANHPLTDGTVKRGDLNGLSIIGFESGSAIRTIIDATLAAAQLHLDVVAELRSIPTMLNMVIQTGIPAFVSRSSLIGTNGALAEIRVRNLNITRELALATRQHVPTTAATTAFIDLLQNTYPASQ